MNFPNVMEMPISHTKEDISLNQVEDILAYNLNDVLATYEFYKKTIEFGKIDLRKKIISKFHLPCINWNNGKIGENLILKLYCDKTGKDVWDVKKMRSIRSKIALKDCIPDNISFKHKQFQKIYDSFKNKEIDVNMMKEKKEKGGNSIGTIFHKGCTIDYGLGGVHGVTKPGIYISDKDYIIKSCDVASLYPNLPLVYNFYIEHLGPEFLEVYRDNIVGVRLAEKLKPKAEQDKAIVDGFKEAANIPYGKSNDINSFLYDPLYTLKTTVSGQLITSMLCEELGQIPDCKILMYNTDGMEVLIQRKYENLYNQICQNWEKYTGLILEYVDYNKIWISDVN